MYTFLGAKWKCEMVMGRRDWRRKDWDVQSTMYHTVGDPQPVQSFSETVDFNSIAVHNDWDPIVASIALINRQYDPTSGTRILHFTCILKTSTGAMIISGLSLLSFAVFINFHHLHVAAQDVNIDSVNLRALKDAVIAAKSLVDGKMRST
jgi:hypothetical protein